MKGAADEEGRGFLIPDSRFPIPD